MDNKKGPLSILIRDAISSIDIDGDNQKAINVKTEESKLFNEKVTNMQRGGEIPELFNIRKKKVPISNDF